MKIGITRTEICAMPQIAWDRFCAFTLAPDVEYTPIQQTAVTCMRYSSRVHTGGHAGLLETCGDAVISLVAHDLVCIGVPGFAENLIEAAKNGQKDNCAAADEWFWENEDTLIAAIQEYWQRNLEEFYEIADEDYTMRPPKFLLWLGAFEALFFFVLMTVFAITIPKDVWLIIPTFSALASLGLVLVVYAMTWRATVLKDMITVCRPLRKTRSVRIDEISKVRRRRDNIAIYVRGRKAFSVETAVSGFNMFCAQLYLAGKIVEVKEETANITIRQSKVNIAEGILAPFFGVGIFLWSILRHYDPTVKPASIYEKLFFAAVMLFSLWFMLHLLLWKVIVSEDTLTVKKAFSGKKEYSFQEITKVDIDDQKMIIFVRGKKAAAIAFACKGCSALSQKLQSEGIPFYRNGELL